VVSEILIIPRRTFVMFVPVVKNMVTACANFTGQRRGIVLAVKNYRGLQFPCIQSPEKCLGLGLGPESEGLAISVLDRNVSLRLHHCFYQSIKQFIYLSRNKC